MWSSSSPWFWEWQTYSYRWPQSGVYCLSVQNKNTDCLCDTDRIVISEEGQLLYKNDLIWCQRFNIRTVADLEHHIVDASKYQHLWIQRCNRAYNLLTKTNAEERLQIERQYTDLFLYGANEDLTIYYFENNQGQLFEFKNWIPVVIWTKLFESQPVFSI